MVSHSSYVTSFVVMAIASSYRVNPAAFFAAVNRAKQRRRQPLLPGTAWDGAALRATWLWFSAFPLRATLLLSCAQMERLSTPPARRGFRSPEVSQPAQVACWQAKGPRRSTRERNEYSRRAR